MQGRDMSNTYNTPAPQGSRDPEEIYRPQFEEDTISLVDLVAVVVRHRRLIIGGTILVALAVIAALYAPAPAGLEIGPQREFTVERSLYIASIPPGAAQYVNLDIPAAVRGVLADPRVVGNVYREFEEDPPEDRSQEQYLTMVRRDIIDQRLRVSWDNNTRTITLSFAGPDSASTAAFLQELLHATSAALSRTLQPLLMQATQDLATSLESTQAVLAQLVSESVGQTAGPGGSITPEAVLMTLNSSGGPTLSAFNETRATLDRMEAIAQEPASLLRPLGSTAVYEEPTGSRSMIVIISTITAFFLTVFLAFVLEYIRRVKEDPEEVGKLTAAWRRE